MLRIERGKLPQNLQRLLDNWQVAVNMGELNRIARDGLSLSQRKLLNDWQARLEEGQSVSDLPWIAFKSLEKRPDRAILETLIEMFHGKCTYCETPDANHIDHYWPKSPHPAHNANKGTPERMFVWDNLFLSCHKCNSWECKGAHMKWDNGRPRLLNPCLDDPLCYFDITVDYQVAQSINLWC